MLRLWSCGQPQLDAPLPQVTPEGVPTNPQANPPWRALSLHGEALDAMRHFVT